MYWSRRGDRRWSRTDVSLWEYVSHIMEYRRQIQMLIIMIVRYDMNELFYIFN